ncbi:helix-turn-helix domain-containing protein [Micromonospora sp. R77]|uniref:helix-turn-helix domain-containing protein n=1 Tax=Micromonospora sp. R77 TaxID=2925836 RepID=UPI001F603F36|nr:helix-turn-helix domain-containing protein [Micromonospora sp. R77]MCI4065140.1 helix-turn-helix domain-containing protein [Micromonospora sp. R77]
MAGAQLRGQVRSEVMERQAEIAESVVATITARIPAYAALSPGQLDEVRAIASWGTGRVLDLWVAGGELSPDDLRRFRGIGAARALDGRPLPAVLRAYRLAGQEVTSRVEQIGADRLAVADMMDLARLWMACIDALSEAIYEGYATATARVSGDRAHALGDLVDDLLVGRQVTRTGLADRARELGVTLTDRLTMVLLCPADPHTEVTLEALDAFLPAPPAAATIPLRVRDGLGIALLATGQQLDTAGLARRRWRGCRLADLTVTQLPSRFRLGANLLRHAPTRAFRPDRPLLAEADAHVVGLLTRHADADPQRLAALVLGGAQAGGLTHLTEGLDAYLATGSASRAAELLGVHPQTMRYRLRRLRDLTGRDARDAWDRLVLEAALLVAGPGSALSPSE